MGLFAQVSSPLVFIQADVTDRSQADRLSELLTGMNCFAATPLVEGLPGYMHPRGFHHREEIPLTTVGKVDRKLLTEEFVAIA